MGNIVIISVTSGIGTELAKRYSINDNVIGTFRSPSTEYIPAHLMYCDIDNKDSISAFISNFDTLNKKWDTVILCPCNPLPIKPFFDSNIDEWSNSVNTNAVNQLRVLHGLYKYRNKNSNVVFFAAGGTNGSVLDFSAYTASKIMLIKMCELLDSENEDVNFFIVGPGWTKTKIHDIILNNSCGDRHKKTLEFVTSNDGTSMDDIYNCIQWLCSIGKTASGRNFSVVHDSWGTEELLNKLKNDSNLYKLRRNGNETGRSI